MPLFTTLVTFSIEPVVPPAPILKVPRSIFVVPAYVLVAVRESMPVPFCDTLPEPLITLARVILSLRLNIKVPLSTIPLALLIVPCVTPSPTTKVPLLIVVNPP